MIASISDDQVVWDTILKPLYAMGAGWVKKCAWRAKNNRARRERSCHPEGDALLRPEGASRAKGAEGPHPEDAGGFPDSPEVPFFAVTPQLCLRRLVLASSISLTPPQAAGLVHFAARPLQTANATLVCCLVPFLSCQKKVCKKEALDAFYSADARKNRSLHSTYYRYTSGQGTPFGRP